MLPMSKYQEINNLTKDATLVAVTKSRTAQEVQELYDEGCRDFGENRVQELITKMESLPSDVRWHLIGTLQKNKIKKVIGKTHLIHSVDTIELAEAISKHSSAAGVVTQVLLQVNVSGEVTKHGFTQESLEEEIQRVVGLSGIVVQGLMTMAPHTDDAGVVRGIFAFLRALRDRCNTSLEKKDEMYHLSMGMSNDYLIAIQEGATLVRVGRVLW
jgi:PLP dependent protein